MNNNEAKFQSIIENSGSIIAVTDIDGITNYINYTIGGVTKEDYLGTSVFNWVQDDLKETVKTLFDNTIKEKKPNI